LTSPPAYTRSSAKRVDARRLRQPRSLRAAAATDRRGHVAADRYRRRRLAHGTGVEELSETFLELEDTEVPANYIVRQRSEQAGLRKSLLRIYHLQREEFLPSAYAMIVTLVGLILILLLLTDFGGTAESLVAVGFLSFFFLALLRLLNVISTPFKAGQERTDDDVSLFLLSEFVVHAQAEGEMVVEDVEALAEDVEEQLIEAEEQAVDPAKAADRATAQLARDE
jgi:hypothetical protein